MKEVGLGESQGGRRSVSLQFNCQAGYVIGIEITSQEITIALADLKNVPTDIRRFKVDMKNPDVATPELIKIIKQVIRHEDNQLKKVFGIAIAFPGMLNTYEGISAGIIMGEAIKSNIITYDNMKTLKTVSRWF